MRALLVDDDVTSASLLKLALQSENMMVERVEAGLEALEMVKVYDFDVMILELDLPDIAGDKLVRRMRAADINLPMMMLSKIDDKAAKIDAFNAGVDDYVTKPFDREELVVRLRGIIRRAKGHAGSVIRIGRLAVDVSAKTVEIDGKPLNATAKEYGILELLALRRGMTLTKENFLDHLYGGMDEPEQKIIDVFICKLRKKIAAITGEQNAIRTIWGRGYMLEDGEGSTGLAEEATPFGGAAASSETAGRRLTELDLLMLDLLVPA
ncbi:MAG: response regulator transcription factor [Alphaproteobacteria bacterium]|nr:response regulator transcription factor [Alphaproteobacteria bacterium]